MVSERRTEGITPAWVQERLDVLRALAIMPLRGEDKVVGERTQQTLVRIREAVDGPEGSLLAFTKPIAEAVRDFSSFRLTGTQASNIIGYLLMRYAIAFPSPLDQMAGREPVREQIDHLISLTSMIDRDRHRYDLGSYAQLTYLGLMWSTTAVLMANQLAKRLRAQSAPEDLSRWFERRSLYAEELGAHELVPSISHPVFLAPLGFVEYQRARTIGIRNRKGLYAGVNEPADLAFDPEEEWARVQAYSASCDRLGTSYGGYEDFLSPALGEHLFQFLMTMKLGQSMR